MDGGGAKGVYTLGVLREIEAVSSRPLCEVFDLIYGTSTGSIIAALIALGYRVDEIENHYFKLIPDITGASGSRRRSKALREQAKNIFGDRKFDSFKVPIGIVAANHGHERPMIFKYSAQQAHGRAATFKPGFGCTIADAVLASSAAYPFFEKVAVVTENQGTQLLMDGGYVANNPTLFALADAREAFKQADADIVVISVGVGGYIEPKRGLLKELIIGFWPFRHISKMFNISSTTIEQLTTVLFPNVSCIRINETYAQPEYATDLLERNPEKLRVLHGLGRESYAKHERRLRELLKI